MGRWMGGNDRRRKKRLLECAAVVHISIDGKKQTKAYSPTHPPTHPPTHQVLEKKYQPEFVPPRARRRSVDVDNFDKEFTNEPAAGK